MISFHLQFFLEFPKGHISFFCLVAHVFFSRLYYYHCVSQFGTIGDSPTGLLFIALKYFTETLMAACKVDEGESAREQGSTSNEPRQSRSVS